MQTPYANKWLYQSRSVPPSVFNLIEQVRFFCRWSNPAQRGQRNKLECLSQLVSKSYVSLYGLMLHSMLVDLCCAQCKECVWQISVDESLISPVGYYKQLQLIINHDKLHVQHYAKLDLQPEAKIVIPSAKRTLTFCIFQLFTVICLWH